MFALVDANSFYCSAEQVFRPDWRGKPIVVLSNNDGCIVAANKQAVALGINKFQPFFESKALCEKQGIIVCSSNYELYADLSHKMMQIIARFAPEQQIYSIDECFLSFEQCDYTIGAIKDLQQHAQKIRRTVWKELRLPVSVGIANTFTRAKMANHISKKWPGFQGVCVLHNESFIKQALQRLSVADIWGVGRRTSKKLIERGVSKAAQLCQLTEQQLKAEFTVPLQRTIQELNGQVCYAWDSVRADKQQIFSTRSVGKRIKEQQALNEALAKHISIACANLRQQGSLCAALLLFAGNSPHDKQPCRRKLLIPIQPPTDDTSKMLALLREHIKQLFVPGVAYYKLGVGLLDLTSAQHWQYDLFHPKQGDSPLMQVMDNINQRYGRDTSFFASQGINPDWSMRRSLLTKQYTTNWQHIPKIRC